jgi:hypothetical protein
MYGFQSAMIFIGLVKIASPHIRKNLFATHSNHKHIKGFFKEVGWFLKKIRKNLIF